MKKLLFGIFLTVTALTSCSHPGKVVEAPASDGTNNTSLAITKVTLSDDKTVVSFIASNPNHYYRTVEIGNTAHLEADGKEYQLLSKQNTPKGFTIGQPYTLEDGVPMEFDLAFDPLPESTDYFDFIDTDAKKWILNVNLTGAEAYASVPTELLHPDLDAPLPTYEPGEGTATLNIHMVAYRPWMKKGNMLVVNYNNGPQKCLSFTPDAEGNATLEVDVTDMHDAWFSCTASGTIGSVYPAAGQTEDVYLFPSSSSATVTPLTHQIYEALSTGRYGVHSYLQHNPAYVRTIYDGSATNMKEFWDSEITSEQYTQLILDAYNAKNDSLAAHPEYPQMLREYIRQSNINGTRRLATEPLRYLQDPPGREDFQPSFTSLTPEQLDLVESTLSK